MIIFAENFDASLVKFSFSILLCLTITLANCQDGQNQIVTKDLRSDWKHFSNGAFTPFNSKNKKAVVYFEVDPDRFYKGSYLEIRSARSLSVFLNYKLILRSSKAYKISIDSLSRAIPPPWLFSVYNKEGHSWLKTQIRSPKIAQENLDNTLRKADHYLNVAILISFFLSAVFVILLRTNTRLTLDYFNFGRLFTIQIREDTLLNSRISSSVNVLFYIFCSMALGFTLLTVFHFGASQISLAESFKITSVGQGLWQWLKLSTAVMIFLVVKLIILSGLTQLFNFREAIGPQFYNFIRLCFFVFTLSGLTCLCYFIFKIQSEEAYTWVLKSINFFLVFWFMVIGLKLLSRSSFRFFQLFSYLCASELIPIVILVKVLNS